MIYMLLSITMIVKLEALYAKGGTMGDLIVGGLIALMVILILRSLHKAVSKSGACAFCSYAKHGCDHVGHHELDLEQAESRLNDTQKAILARHKYKRG